MLIGGGALLKNLRVMALCCRFRGCEFSPMTMYGWGVAGGGGVGGCRRRTRRRAGTGSCQISPEGDPVLSAGVG